MNRVFHEKITAGMLFLLVMALVLTFVFAWQKSWGALPFLAVSIICIERILHTTYTITPQGLLHVYHGRFGGNKKITLQQIVRIERHYMFNIYFHVGSYLLLVLRDGKELSVWPVKEKEFIDWIEKTRGKNNV